MNTPATTLLTSPEPTLAGLHLGSSASIAGPTKAAVPADEASLREALKRCSPSTFEAARAFRATGDYAHVPTIVTGVIERFVERNLREKLAAPSADELLLSQDLGLDSLTMMEIVLLAEDVLPLSINNEELRHLRTLGDVKLFTDAKLRGLPLPARLSAPPAPALTASASA